MLKYGQNHTYNSSNKRKDDIQCSNMVTYLNGIRLENKFKRKTFIKKKRQTKFPNQEATTS